MTDTQKVLAEVLLEKCKPTSTQNVELHSRFKRYYVRSKSTPFKNNINLEATPRIELGYKDLQSSA